jgi:hypothetical protein
MNGILFEAFSRVKFEHIPCPTQVAGANLGDHITGDQSDNFI